MAAARQSRSTGWRLFLRQCRALIHKSLLIRARSWQINLLQLLQAVIVVLLIFVVDRAVTYSSNSFFAGSQAQTDPPAKPITSIPSCRDDMFIKSDEPCHTFIYTPAGIPLIDQVVAGVLVNNQPPLQPDEVLGMSSPAEVDQHLSEHPQTVLAAVHFRQLNDKSWAYVLQTNDSVSYWKGRFNDLNRYIQLPLQVAVEREFARLALQEPNLGWHVALREFPHPSLSTASVVGRIAPVFLLASLMVNTVMLMQSVIGEREAGLRGVMVSMGLMNSAYWASILVVEIILALFQAGLLTVLMIAFRFSLAVRNAASLLFLLLFTSALALTAFALAITTILRRRTQAIPVAVVVFIIAWVFMVVMTFGVPYNGCSNKGLVFLFSIFPWSLLSKGLLDLADAATGTSTGIKWSLRYAYCQSHTPSLEEQAQLSYWKSNCAVPIADAILLLLAQAGFYMLLALYLDAVIPLEEGGSACHWLFPLLPSTWLPATWTKKHGMKHIRHALLRSDDNQISQKDEDVAAEEEKVRHICQSWLMSDNSSLNPESTPLNLTSTHAGEATAASSDSSDVTMPLEEQEMVISEVPTVKVNLDKPNTSSELPEGVFLFGLSKSYWTARRRHTSSNTIGQPSYGSTAEVEAVPDHMIDARRVSSMGRCSDDVVLPETLEQEGNVQEGSVVDTHASNTMATYASSTTSSIEPQEVPVKRNSGKANLYRSLKLWWIQRREARRLVAVQPTWLFLPPGSCFCLLGPNGAGKTTTIKCLQGMVEPTAGDALVYGHSIRSTAGLPAARDLTGICPQFDVLWPELTAMEHLQLFLNIMGIITCEGDDEDMEAMQLLTKVGLHKAAHRRAGTFSGGMRRRLSLAIALLGQPRLLVLDEPSTGLDPQSRRQMWSLLSDAKVGRSVLLTTHSMEEADVLGDRIGIFVGGALRCLGSSLHLKSGFGDGFKVVVGLTTQDPHPGGSLADRCAAVHELVDTCIQAWEASNQQTSGSHKPTENHSTSIQTAAAAADKPPTELQPSVSHETASAAKVDSMEPSCSNSPQPNHSRASVSNQHGSLSQQGLQPELSNAVEYNEVTTEDGSKQPEPTMGGRSMHSTNDINESEIEAMPGHGSNDSHKEQLEALRYPIHYERLLIPTQQQEALPQVFAALQSAEEQLGVVDVHVGLTSLEDVFLRIVAAAGGAAAR